MGAVVNEFIEKTDAKIENLKLGGKRKTFFLSMKFSSMEIDMLETYYKNKGYDFEAHLCPRGLWDIFITFS